MVSAAPAISEKTLARGLEQQIIRVLHDLGESGTEELGSGKYLLRNKTERDKATQNAGDAFREEIHKWYSGYGRGKEVFFFNLLRKRCYELYDKTNAWDTTTALAWAISQEITAHGEETGAAPMLLQAMLGFLELIKADMASFQGLNRGSNHSVTDNTKAAGEQTGKLIALLEPGERGPAGLAPDEEAVRKELLAEAQALDGVYRGIHLAAEALVGHEAAIRTHYKNNKAEADTPRKRHAAGQAFANLVTGSPAARWPDQQVTERLLAAQGRVGDELHRLEERKETWKETLSDGAAERTEDLASRLGPWESLLESLAAEYRHSEPMRLPSVRIRYCFPFAVKVTESRAGEMSPALKRRIPGVHVTNEQADAAPETTAELDSVLTSRMNDLDEGSAEVGLFELTDFWAGAGEGMYGGNRVVLSALSDAHHPDDGEWRVWIDLSRLENHCMCIERTLKDPTPHQLYKALRCPADYSRGTDYRYHWKGRPHGYWRGLDEFAHDVILTVAAGLADEDRPEYVKGHFQVIVLVDADVSATDLEGLYGAELLCTNVNRDAATLEEWVRYPAAANNGKPAGAQGNFGYKENWWSVLEDTTIFGVVGNPSWQAVSYQEAAQYAASWTPRLLLWNRELMQALEQRSTRMKKNRKELSDLRMLEQTVRRSVTDAHAEELCRLRSDRRYLEWMMEAVGTTGVQEDLERRIHAMRLLISENERKEQDRMDARRNFFLAAIALFGVLNVSAFFAVLDSGNSSGLFKSHGAIRYEFIAQGVLVLLVIAVFVAVELWRKADR
jgi:hypothetical protein